MIFFVFLRLQIGKGDCRSLITDWPEALFMRFIFWAINSRKQSTADALSWEENYFTLDKDEALYDDNRNHGRRGRVRERKGWWIPAGVNNRSTQIRLNRQLKTSIGVSKVFKIKQEWRSSNATYHWPKIKLHIRALKCLYKARVNFGRNKRVDDKFLCIQPLDETPQSIPVCLVRGGQSISIQVTHHTVASSAHFKQKMIKIRWKEFVL